LARSGVKFGRKREEAVTALLTQGNVEEAARVAGRSFQELHPEGYQMRDWIDNAVALQMGRFEAQIDRYMCLPCRVEFNARVRGKHELEKHLA
jgi:hypothetical protein